ncbi:MAG: MFS transporter [Actinobacteria bacterium]|nr:MFS transporter [Actinomycetota bacterium]
MDMLFHAALSPLLPHYSEELGLSKGAAGVLSAAYAAGTLAGTLPATWLAMRLGARRSVLVGLALVAASTLLFAFASALVWLDLARFVQGVGGAFTWIGALSWLMLEAESKRRGELIGGVLAGAVAGELIGPVVGSAATLSSPEVVFSLLAALVALLLWAAWATPAATSRRPVDLAALGRLDRERRRILVGWWLVTLPAVFAGVLTVLGPLRLDELGASGAAIGAVWLVAAGAEAILSPLIGRLSDRRGRMLPIRTGLACAVPAALVLPLPGHAVLEGLAIIAAVVALAAFWAPAIASLSDTAQATGVAYALVFALVNAGWAAGQVVGAAGGAALAGLTTDAVPYGALAALCLLTLALSVADRRPGQGFSAATSPSSRSACPSRMPYEAANTS